MALPERQNCRNSTETNPSVITKRLCQLLIIGTVFLCEKQQTVWENPGFPIAGYRTFCVFFNVNEASVYRALLAFIFSEKIFEGGMTRRDSRHCPQFLKTGNSPEFSMKSRPAFHL